MEETRQKIKLKLDAYYIMNYFIAIPTYNRHDIISKKTIKFLEANNIEPSKIYLFVANQSEKIKYINSLEDKYWKNIIVGELGLLQQRKFISNFFPSDSFIVQMDDDINDMIELYNDESGSIRERKFRNLDFVIKHSFEMCISNKCHLWGFYPNDNPYFMKSSISLDLKLIVGSFFGIINDKEIENNIQITEKEDYERSILYFKKYGKTMRYNYIGITTNYFKCRGGLQSPELNHNRQIEAKLSVEYLLNKYPTFCKRANKKSIPDIRLNRIPSF